MRSGSTSDPGVARRRAVEPELDDLGEHLAAVGPVEVTHDHSGLHLGGTARLGHEDDGARGMRSSSPISTR